MKLSDAQKTVSKLTARRDELAPRLLAAKGDGDQIAARRADLEQRAYGRDDAEAERELEAVEREAAKNLSKQRGIAAEHVDVMQQLARTHEARRQAQLSEDTARAQTLTAEIAELRARMDTLNAERAQLLGGRMDAAPREAGERIAEQDAVQESRQVYDSLATAPGRKE